MNRIDRLTAILIHLQSKRTVTAQEIARRFGISIRTVYRDVRALEEAGVPIGAEAGVGYFLENYHLPPVMFTTNEASALLFGSKVIEKFSDHSVKKAFESALFKIKSVLKSNDKEHLAELESRVAVFKPGRPEPFSNDFLTPIQQAIGQKRTLQMTYYSYYNGTTSQREIEPVGLAYYGMGWHLIAFCRLRNDFRDFRLDRIESLALTERSIEYQHEFSLQQYLDTYNTPQSTQEAVVCFEKSVCRYLSEQRYGYGFVSQEDLGTQVRMRFQTAHLHTMARWLLMYGNSVTVEHPPRLLEWMQTLAGEISEHYLKSTVDSLSSAE